MKSIYIDEDLAAIRQAVAEFVEKEIVPNVDQWERTGEVPRSLLEQMGSLGFFGLRVPEEHGGVGLGHIASVVFAGELGRSTSGGTAITVLVHTDLAMPYLTRFGSEEQKARWLPGMMTGELISAIGVTEPDAGSDVAAIRTTARRDGEGWRLNGTKMFITNGGIADLVFIAARTDPDAKASRGMTIFAVEKGTEGFTATRALEKMGWHASNTAELVLDDVWCPTQRDRRGQPGLLLRDGQLPERANCPDGAAIGECQEAIDRTVAHVKERRAFGAPLWRSRRSGSVRHAAGGVDAASLVITPHGCSIRRGGPGGVGVQGPGGRASNRVLYDASSSTADGIHAGDPVERMYRDVRINSIGGGATEVMLDEIAKRL